MCLQCGARKKVKGWGKIDSGKQNFQILTDDLAIALSMAGFGRAESRIFWFAMLRSWAPGRAGKVGGKRPEAVPVALPVCELARRLGCDPATVSRAIARLVARDFLIRDGDLYRIQKEACRWLDKDGNRLLSDAEIAECFAGLGDDLRVTAVTHESSAPDLQVIAPMTSESTPAASPPHPPNKNARASEDPGRSREIPEEEIGPPLGGDPHPLKRVGGSPHAAASAVRAGGLPTHAHAHAGARERAGGHAGRAATGPKGGSHGIFGDPVGPPEPADGWMRSLMAIRPTDGPGNRSKPHGREPDRAWNAQTSTRGSDNSPATTSRGIPIPGGPGASRADCSGVLGEMLSSILISVSNSPRRPVAGWAPSARSSRRTTSNG